MALSETDPPENTLPDLPHYVHSEVERFTFSDEIRLQLVNILFQTDIHSYLHSVRGDEDRSLAHLVQIVEPCDLTLLQDIRTAIARSREECGKESPMISKYLEPLLDYLEAEV